MKTLEYWKRGFSMLAVFEGEDTQSEYWNFILGNFMVQLGLLAILIFALIIGFEPLVLGAVVSSFLHNLMSLIPTLSASVRRMNDTGKSPYLLFLIFVPLGIIALVILLAQESQSRGRTYFDTREEEVLDLPVYRYDERDLV